VRALFQEYQAAIGLDLCFQGFARELAGLPGAYARPAGCLLLAEDGDRVLGCVGLRPFAGRDAELKRLWVRPTARCRALGEALVHDAIAVARQAGYARVLLDTLPSMDAALRLYRRVGFVPTAPYRPNPVAGAVYLTLTLDR